MAMTTVILAGTSTGKVVQMDAGVDDLGVAITSTLETGDLTGGGTGKLILHRIEPLFEKRVSGAGVLVDVQAGIRNQTHGSPVFGLTKTITYDTVNGVALTRRGKRIRIKLSESRINNFWELNSLRMYFSNETW